MFSFVGSEPQQAAEGNQNVEEGGIDLSADMVVDTKTPSMV